MVTRRQVLKGSGAAAATAATGGAAWWGLSGTVFIAGTDEGELEGQADGFRGNIENLDKELDNAFKDVSVSTKTEDYEGRGEELIEGKFNTAIPADPQSFNIPREVDEESVMYTWQEGTGPVGLDETWESIESQIGLSSQDEGILEDVKEEFGKVVLYTATTEDHQPDYTDNDIDDLEDLHEDLEDEFDEVVGYLNDLANEITNVRALNNELEAAEYQKSHKLPLVGEVWGESYNGDQITKDEVESLQKGEDQYDGIGLEESLDMAQEEYRDAAKQAARVGIVKELVGQTVADAKDQLETYGEPDDSEKPSEPSCTYDDFSESDRDALAEEGYTQEDVEDVIEKDNGYVKAVFEDGREYIAETSC